MAQCEQQCEQLSKPRKYIRRGTTPKQIFTFCDITDIATLATILITYAQKGTIILERTKDAMTIENQTVWFRLTQEETLSFNLRAPVEIQVRALSDGVSLASDIFEVPVERILNEEVLQ